MKQSITWKDKGLNSVDGRLIEVNIRYSSFDETEINDLINVLINAIGSGIYSDSISTSKCIFTEK